MTTTAVRVWTDDEKELAYQVWAYQAGRNVVQTAKKLALEHELDIPRTTVDYWSRAHGWSERRQTDLRHIAPDLEHHVTLELKLGSVDAVHLLRKVVQEDKEVIERFGRNLPAAVNAAKALIEMGGWHTKGDTRLHLDTPKDTRTIDLTNATDEELRELELTMLE